MKNSVKFLDFHELVHLKISSEDHHFHSSNFLTLEKDGLAWTCYFANKEIFLKTCEILKNYCILNNFTDEFETLQLLGKGNY